MLRPFITTICVVFLCGTTATAYAQDLTFNGQPFVPSFEIGTNIRNIDASTVYEVNPAVSGHGLTATPISLRRRNECYGPDDSHVIKIFSHVLNMPSILKVDRIADPYTCLPTLSVSVGHYVDLFEPENGAHHIGMAAWTARGRTRMQGVIRYESNDRSGICGGAVVGLLNHEGRLLHYYTPPTGCGDGRIFGQANQRFVAWEDTIPPAVRSKVRSVRVQPMFTEGRDKASWERLIAIGGSIAAKAAEVVKILGAAGVV
jgi:hypothetical protein